MPASAAQWTSSRAERVARRRSYGETTVEVGLMRRHDGCRRRVSRVHALGDSPGEGGLAGVLQVVREDADEADAERDWRIP